MSWTQISSNDPGWTDETSASAQTWSSGLGGTDDLWNRLGDIRDAHGGVDLVPVVGGGWVIGPARNDIKIGPGANRERKP